jgi:uncharacterized damage-inducible protein DinB
LQEIRRIADQLKRSFHGQAWHGPSLEDLLRDTALEQAADRPLPRTHSIWEIVLHITAWYDVVRRRLQGEDLEPTPEQDWPPVAEPTAAAWRTALGNLQSVHEELLVAVIALDPARLEDLVRGTPYSVYFMLHGLIQHNLYHAGQIAILKKA